MESASFGDEVERDQCGLSTSGNGVYWSDPVAAAVDGTACRSLRLKLQMSVSACVPSVRSTFVASVVKAATLRIRRRKLINRSTSRTVADSKRWPKMFIGHQLQTSNYPGKYLANHYGVVRQSCQVDGSSITWVLRNDIGVSAL